MNVGYSIEKRGSTYRVILSGGFDDKGQRIRHSATLPVGTTKAEAHRRARELLALKEKGLRMEATRETVAAYLRRWLVSRDGAISPRTLDGYRGYIERSIIPHIGTIPLSKLRPDAVEAMEKALVKIMSPTSVVQVHRILRKALQDALRWDLVARNVADVVTPPRKATPEMKPLTPEQLDMFLTEADGTQLGPLFHLDAHTGLRRAELCGLKWSDIDLGQGTLGVQRTIQRIRGKGFAELPPKTKRSRRVVELGDEAVASLRRHRANQAQQRLLAGPAWHDGDYVFTRPDGRHLDPDKVSHAFHDLVVKVGLQGVRLHDTRHTHATILFRQGIPLRTIQDRLGHSTIQTTSDIYLHTEPGQQAEAKKAVDQALRQARKVAI